MTAHQQPLSDDVLVLAPAQPELRIVVHGTPTPQGNMVRGQWGGVYEKNAKKLQPWRDSVAAAARDAMEGTWPDLDLPLHPRGTAVAIMLTFTLDRPGGHFGTGRNAGVLKDSAPAIPTGRPDLDKLVRAAIDSLAAAGVMKDDTQVGQILARKFFTHSEAGDALDIPGAVIRVRALP